MTVTDVVYHLLPKEYFRRFLQYNIRPDQRHLGEIRKLRFRKSLLPTTIGSTIISAGRTRYVAGVTAEIAKPDPAASKSGKVCVQIEFPKSCGVDTDIQNSLLIQIRLLLSETLNSEEVIDLTQFCIKDMHSVWVLYVNIVCLEYDGNPNDWALTAAVTALENSILPSVVWDNQRSWWCITQGNTRPVKLKERPVSITYTRLLDEFWIIDPTAKEESLGGQNITIWRAGNNGKLNFWRQNGDALIFDHVYAALASASSSGFSAREKDLAVAAQQADEEDSLNPWIVCTEEETDDDEK